MQSLIIHLLCFKYKMKHVVWSKGASGLEGKFQSGSEIIEDVRPFKLLDFYIDDDMIHIADTKSGTPLWRVLYQEDTEV
ncbi:hypothetical protein NQ317_017967 [Molorchus minor]|uniref:Uncharacterized protein n=1 Tax=Molorchus minor TaxID=1323400 RepID=A0ABQ9JME4_9CUCU|nr:hypothetical protein NQ317_017967 [Molorchus minor]